MSAPRWKTILIYLIASLWVAALLAALWWFQGRYLRPFDERVVAFSGDALKLPDHMRDKGDVTLVHFWDPACPCNSGNQAHLAQLLATYADRGVSFYALQKPGSSGQLPKPLRALVPLAAAPGAEALPSSPAVAIWDRADQLVYFGPYSAGFTCNSSNSFIEPVIDAVLAGRTVRNTNALAVGCFCDWSPSPRSPSQP